MIPVILWILKIIGIIIVSLLGLFIFGVCLTLFVPVTYYVSAKKYDEIIANFKVTWLFRMISFKGNFENNKFVYQIRIFVFLFRDSEKPKKIKKTKTKRRKVKNKKNKKKKLSNANKNLLEDNKSDKSINDSEEDKFTNDSKVDDPITQADEPITQVKISLFSKFITKIKDIYKNILKIPKVICDFLSMLKDKMISTEEKIQKFVDRVALIIAFVKDKENVKSVKIIWARTKKVLKSIRPRKFFVKIKFGTDDPCLTGQILGCAAIIYQFSREHITVTPDFEKSMLEGEIEAKGRIFSVTVILYCIRLILCKEYKLLTRNYKKLKEEL